MLNKIKRAIIKIIVTTLLVTAISTTTLPLVASAASTSLKSESTTVSQKETIVRSQKALDKAIEDKTVSAIKLYGTKDGKKVIYKLSKDCDKKLMVMTASTVRFTIPKKVKVKTLIVYVANQQELNTWKNINRMTTLVIKTEKEVKITIRAKDFSKVNLIINAPKATIINYASFKKIDVNKAGKWINKLENSEDDNALSDNVNNVDSSNNAEKEGATDDTSSGGTGGGFIPGPINPNPVDPEPVTPTPIDPSPIEPTPTPIDPLSDVAYVINYYIDNVLQKTIKGDDLKQGEVLRADLKDFISNVNLEIDDELTTKTQTHISSTTDISNNTLNIYYKTKTLPTTIIDNSDYIKSLNSFNDVVGSSVTGSAIIVDADGQQKEIVFPDGQVSINLPDGYELDLNNLNAIYYPDFRDWLEVGSDNNSFNYNGVVKNYATVFCKILGNTDYVLLVDTLNNKTYVFISNDTIRSSNKSKVNITMLDGSIQQYVLWESIGINDQTGYISVKNTLPGTLVSYNDSEIRVSDSTNSNNTAVISDTKVNGLPITAIK